MIERLAIIFIQNQQQAPRELDCRVGLTDTQNFQTAFLWAVFDRAHGLWDVKVLEWNVPTKRPPY